VKSSAGAMECDAGMKRAVPRFEVEKDAAFHVSWLRDFNGQIAYGGVEQGGSAFGVYIPCCWWSTSGVLRRKTPEIDGILRFTWTCPILFEREVFHT
jgi:hypothetical protein